MYCNAAFEKKEGLVSAYSVVESKKIQEAIKYVTFNVQFNEEDFEVQCECHLFELGFTMQVWGSGSRIRAYDLWLS